MKPAIEVVQLRKRYPLYRGRLAQALGALGVPGAAFSWKVALDGIDIAIQRGEKVGVIGRNGSGKTTLLRLVMGQTLPNGGRIEINGTVQGLMQTGFGFHDEMSGLDNIANALVYNGIAGRQFEEAVSDVVDFVELGKFIQHPLKTYSLGMRARLEFATATAIRPDILVIDEVLGAGDGYFVSKCAARMRDITADSTLMLVSHSLDQILQYCDRVVWLDNGRIVDDGPAQPVVTAYRHFMANQYTKERGLRQDASTLYDPDGLPSREGKVPPEVLALRPTLEPQPPLAIVACRFEGEDPAFHATETGRPLDVSCTVRCVGSRAVRPVIFGATQHGALLFEAAAAPTTVVGERTIRLSNRNFNIGVGNYVLVPALRDAESGEILCVGEHTLALRMLPTNWSDPPRIHLDGEWRDGSSGATLETKISAWV